MKEIIFGLLGGLGIFIFGMKYLSDGLQKVAGRRLRRTLRSLTQSRIHGVLLGTMVTCIIQSSSVTTVMLVGLINAGIISFIQGASVTIGANIGTTITAQIIAFKISQYALPAIAIGVIAMLFSKKKKVQFWGQVLVAFGFIFLGLKTMSGVMKPLKNIPAVVDFFVNIARNPFYCILLGTFFTVAVQSSTASIGLLLALANAGLLDFTTSLYIILGDNIGTTITVWLASIGGSVSSKRLACFHTLFNIIGVTYFAFLIKIGIYPKFIDFITPGAVTTETIARHIANSHTFFNVFNALLFLIIMMPVIKLISIIVPGKDIYVSTDFKFLQNELLSTPEIAIESAKKELLAMAEMVKKTVKTAMDGFFESDKKSIIHVQTQESAIDHLQHDITYYLAKLSAQQLTPDLASQLPPLLHSINDLERISDHAVNIAELTEKASGENLKFSNNALAEMRTLYAKIEEMFDNILKAVKDGNEAAINKVLALEGEVNTLQAQYINDHSRRLCERKCDPMSALIFVDYVNNLEKIADHLTNVAQASRAGFSFQNLETSKT